jgi:hypothetical protein
MSTNTPVEADPTKPYKAYVATALALVGLIWANLNGVEDWGTLGFQDWVTFIVPAVLVFGGTYAVENPKRIRRH